MSPMASKEKVENRSREWVNDFRRRCTAKGQGRLKTSNIQVTVSHRLNKRSVSLTKTPTERQSLIVSVHPEPAPFPHEGTESRPSNHCTCHTSADPALPTRYQDVASKTPKPPSRIMSD